MNKEARQNEVNKADVIIKEEIERLKKKLESLHLEHFLHSINLYTEDIRSREVNKSLKMLGESEADVEEVIHALSKSLTKKIMHNFMNGIRSDPFTSREMEKFVNVFMGDEHVSKHKVEKIEE
jgi:glutamyl-tRNA reductase